jgi:hypothetical protein
MGNKEEVKRINVPSRPSAGGTQAKKDDADDTKRVGHKPEAEEVETAKDRPGAATDAVLKQSKDSTRNWWTPTH